MMQFPQSFAFFTAGKTTIINPYGIYVYNGAPATGALVFALATPGHPATDAGWAGSPGNQIPGGSSFGMNTGSWNAVTGAIQAHFGVDASGNLYIVNAANDVLAFFGTSNGRLSFFNSFGATIYVIDPAIGAAYTYTNTGSATQGGLIASDAAQGGTDPIAGYTVLPGRTQYYFNGTTYLAVQIFQSTIFWYTSSTLGGPWNLVTEINGTSTGTGIWIPGNNFSSAGKNFVVGLQPGTPALTSPLVWFVPTNAGDPTLGFILYSEADFRFMIDSNGQISWGPGNTAPDATLRRTAAAAMTLSAALTILSSSWPTLSLSSSSAAGVQITGTGGNWAVAAEAIGDTWPEVILFNTSAQGLAFGPGNVTTDTSLARDSANSLTTPGNLNAGSLNVPSISHTPHFGVDGNGVVYLPNQSSAPGATAGDVKLIGTNADLAYTVGQNGTGGFVGIAPQADLTSHTVTSTSFTTITNSWTIPANGSSPGDVYEIEAWGVGTQGSTVETLRFGLAMNGTLLNQATWPNSLAGASGGFSWRLKARFVAFGSNTWAMEIDGMAGAGGVSTPVHNLTNTTGSWTPTSSNTLEIQMAWGSATGSPTVTCQANYFKKVS